MKAEHFRLGFIVLQMSHPLLRALDVPHSMLRAQNRALGVPHSISEHLSIGKLGKNRETIKTHT